MKKIFTILLSLTVFCSTLLAVPAKRTERIFTQPDGTTVTVVLNGDEHHHFQSTADGIMLKEDAAGYLRYAVSDANGNIVAGEYKAQDAIKRTSVEKAYISKIDRAALNTKISTSRMKKAAARTPIQKAAFPTTGKAKGLIILAQFSDKSFTAGGTNEEFTNKMNQEGYSVNGAGGSARDYFISQSSGAFTPEFTVVGPVTLPQKMSYYGGNDSSGDDKNPAQMVADACNAAQSQVDFSDYDQDGDGYVDLIYIIYAGYGEAQGGAKDTVWPHAWNINYGGIYLKLNGVNIGDYACSCELAGYSGSTLDGAGTFCHEFSHCLGLPDMYDVDYSGNFGLGEWDLMDSGSYANDSKTPVGYSAYERYFVGWLTPDELTVSAKDLQLNALNTSNKAYKITSDKNSNEYYFLENRQLTAWDEYLPNHGMLVTRVTYLKSAWDNNSVNDVLNKQRVTIIPADNKLSEYTQAGDVYPGTSGNTSLTDTSTPDATLFDGSMMGKPITKIAENNGVITFSFMEGIVTAPVTSAATSVSSTGFTANWGAVDGVDSYTLTVAEAATDPESNKVIAEDFKKFTKDATTDISGSLDNYFANAGWTGYKIYQSIARCKLGSSSSAGYLTTPSLDLSGDDGNVTITFDGVKYSGTESSIKVELLDASGSTLESKSLLLAEGTLITFTKGQANCKVRFTASKRGYIGNIAIYTGKFDAGDLQKAKAATTPLVFTGLTTTSYEVTGLTPATTYSYKVTAISGEDESPVSNVIRVTLDPSGVESIESNSTVVVSGNNVIVNAMEGESIIIYSIDGIAVSSAIAAEDENSFTLANGIYIVRIGNTSKKIAILN